MRHAFLAVWLAIVSAVAALAQTATATMAVTLNSVARVSFSTLTVAFPDANPDAVPQVAAVPASIDISAKARAPRNAQVTLTLQSEDDLRSGITVLPASLITWTATGAGFVGGTVSPAAAQLVGSWTGSGVRSGTQSFRFENRWTHPSGTYTLTLVYTLSAP
ncbi:MAG TPA: hypothetical protein VLD67_02445 [Vicinamibacterales bacterium]|nr:hypothetical protein [Vicinamibacterales bacterium]